MTDVTAGQGAGGATGTPRESPDFQLPRFADIAMLFRRGDIALAVGILVILMLLILPLPPLLLDFSLAVSIIFSVLILMTALFIQAPLEFSAFPTVLLISTMLRLSLNLVSTRLISAKWEFAFAESIIGQGDERQLAIKPSRLSEFIALVR